MKNRRIHAPARSLRRSQRKAAAHTATDSIDPAVAAQPMGSSVWGNSRMNGYRDDVRDAWNINFFYAYNF